MIAFENYDLSAWVSDGLVVRATRVVSGNRPRRRVHGIAVIAVGAMFASTSASVAIASGYSRQDIPSTVSTATAGAIVGTDTDRDRLRGSPAVVWSELMKRIRARPEDTRRDPIDLDPLI